MTPRPAPPPAQTLIVEDKDSLRTMLRHALESHGHAVIEARDEPEATRLLQRSRQAVVLSDLRLPHGDGFGVLRAVKEFDPDIPVIVMTAYGGIEDAVAAVKDGARDFLAKPVDPVHLMLLVDRAIDRRRMITENILLKEELGRRRWAPKIVGQDPKLAKVLSVLQRAAGTDTTVLLEGESGTGKELFARALHAFSPRVGALRCYQLCLDSRGIARIRAVRARKGCVHRGSGPEAWQVRDCPQRDAVPR